jgi:hypothetical protein
MKFTPTQCDDDVSSKLDNGSSELCFSKRYNYMLKEGYKP